MPASNIQINGVASSNTDLPINTLVQLSNLDTGGETTYAWVLVSQPEGAADALSSLSIENPTITPKKEGSYKFRLTVNGSLVNEKIFSIRDLKTRERVPAGVETTEADASLGWSIAADRWLKRLSDLYNTQHGVACMQAGENLAQGDVVIVTTAATLKAGLPGAEVVAVVVKAGASFIGPPVGIVETSPSGGTTVTSGGLVLVRFFGPCNFTYAGAPSVGEPVFFNSAAAGLLLTKTAAIADNDPNTRVVGVVTDVTGGQYRIFVTQSHLDVQTHPIAPFIPKQLFAFWRQDNFPANQTGVAMGLYQTGSSMSSRPTFDGFMVTDMFVHLNGAAAGSTITFKIAIDGVADPDLVVTLAIGQFGQRLQMGPYKKILVSGGQVTATFTTPAGWGGTTVDGCVELLGIPTFSAAPP